MHLIGKRALPVGALLLAVAAFYLFGLDDYMTCEMLRENRSAVMEFVHGYTLTALVLYALAYALIVTLSVPGGALMTVTGGFFFGVPATAVAVVVGATAGATALFLIAKTSLGDPLRAKAAPWLKKLEAGFQEDQFTYLLVLRLIPLFPFFVVNLVPAFLGVGVGTYVFATLIGIVPGVIVYSLVGAGLGNFAEGCEGFDAWDVMTPEIVAAFLGVAALLLAPIVYKKIKDRRPG